MVTPYNGASLRTRKLAPALVRTLAPKNKIYIELYPKFKKELEGKYDSTFYMLDVSFIYRSFKKRTKRTYHPSHLIIINTKLTSNWIKSLQLSFCSNRHTCKLNHVGIWSLINTACFLVNFITGPQFPYSYISCVQSCPVRKLSPCSPITL